jgi:hypothetical protein
VRVLEEKGESVDSDGYQALLQRDMRGIFPLLITG